MKELIKELKNEHQAILAILTRIKTLGIASRSGQEQLLAARCLLMAHIRKEDEHYYIGLRKAAETDPGLKIMMDYFVADMEAVSSKAMLLFDTYAQGGDEGEFAGAIKLLYMTLKDRIRTEEETLFRKYPGT